MSEGGAHATMRDVAMLAGVSLKTVSRVINEDPTVGEGLVVRVRRAAAQLNYRPNLTASSLRRRDGRSDTIGLLLRDVSNAFSASLFRSVEDVAASRRVIVLAASVDEDAERERRFTTGLFGRQVDGLILVPASHDHSYLQGEQRSGTPIVFVDRPPRLLAADSVLTDNHGGAAAGVEHLISLGHRRIAFLGHGKSISTERERHNGYRDALRRAGLSEDLDLVRHDLESIEDAEAATAAIFTNEDSATALFTARNILTIGAIRALRALGRQREIAVVGFDDFLLADMLDPSVSVIAQDPIAMGRCAAQLLFRRIEGDASPIEEVVLPTQLQVRGSSIAIR